VNPPVLEDSVTYDRKRRLVFSNSAISDANVKLLAFLSSTGQAYFESFLEPAFERLHEWKTGRLAAVS